MITLPPSGTGVTESLALGQAPFTRMTPSGTLASGCMGCALLEKSPPLLGTLCPQTIDGNSRMTTIRRRENPERTFPPSNPGAGVGVHAGADSLKRTGETPRVPPGHTQVHLQRAQEVQDLLLLLRREITEGLLDVGGFAAAARVSLDRRVQIGRLSIVQEEDALS